jgi:hypothetical protein
LIILSTANSNFVVITIIDIEEALEYYARLLRQKESTLIITIQELSGKDVGIASLNIMDSQAHSKSSVRQPVKTVNSIETQTPVIRVRVFIKHER